MPDSIVRFNAPTSGGNTLQFFYNHENNLVVIDLVDKNGSGGNELFRQTLDEGVLLNHCSKTKKSPPTCIGLPVKPEGPDIKTPSIGVILLAPPPLPTQKEKRIIKTMHLKYKCPGEYEDPEFPYKDWRRDVEQGKTFLGYFDWIIHNLEE
jgi:hypothetical protein